MALSERSVKNLTGVHEDLVKVVKRADELCDIEFVVTEGLRSMKRQRQLMAAGATRTLNSRHISGHAIDLAAVVDGEVRWDWPLYDLLSKAMLAAAKELGVPVIWGGGWRSFKDGPHFELDRKQYP